MITIDVRNINHALFQGIQLIKEKGNPRGSRDGRTLDMNQPVATIYREPMERVLGYYEERDANPFFHLMESLWILLGRNDVKSLAYYNKQMAEYSDNGETFHAAYGHRLRVHFGRDQLTDAINMLRSNPDERRVVLQIWDATVDLNRPEVKDLPCNDLIFLRVRNVAGVNILDMTVCCRSNDVIWGCYGANAVHFSVLHEYLAAMTGYYVGCYTQFSHSYHVYTEREGWSNLKNLRVLSDPYKGSVSVWHDPDSPHKGRYSLFNVPKNDFKNWDTDLELFWESAENSEDFCEPWFELVAVPMREAYHLYKQREFKYALREVQKVAAGDWRTAGYHWLKKREQKHKQKQERKKEDERLKGEI